MNRVYISIGSNLGNRIDNLFLAVTELKKFLCNIRESIILETEAILFEDSPCEWNLPYLNMVVSCDTDLHPQDLLEKLQSIEIKIGRANEYEKWSPRVIDLDILLYGNEKIHTENLIVPHKELKNRPFLQHLLSLMSNKDYELQKNVFLKSFVMSPRLIGIVNVTDDSFSDGGKFFDPEKAVQQSLSLYKSGASMIDIGAQSTRPGADIKTAEYEIKTLNSVLSQLQNYNIPLSIDTFRDEVVEFVLNNYKVDLINDVKGQLKQETLELIKNMNCKICIMHSLSVPPQIDKSIPLDCDPVEEIIKWGQKKVNKLLNIGFSKNNIIFDPGIGFGKNSEQNITILKNLKRFKDLDIQILVGHSRKSYISSFTHSTAENRDIETMTISNLIAKDIDFLRVHDVSNHMKALVTQNIMQL